MKQQITIDPATADEAFDQWAAPIDWPEVHGLSIVFRITEEEIRLQATFPNSEEEARRELLEHFDDWAIEDLPLFDCGDWCVDRESLEIVATHFEREILGAVASWCAKPENQAVVA